MLTSLSVCNFPFKKSSRRRKKKTLSFLLSATQDFFVLASFALDRFGTTLPTLKSVHRTVSALPWSMVMGVCDLEHNSRHPAVIYLKDATLRSRRIQTHLALTFLCTLDSKCRRDLWGIVSQSLQPWVVLIHTAQMAEMFSLLQSTCSDWGISETADALP